MTHKNLPFFIPHLGCPCRCSFCNQRVIAGKTAPPSPQEIHEICKAVYESGIDRKHMEIAFFGGSFTAIPMNMMIGYLEAVKEFVGGNGFSGIRISTRPDAIDPETLKLLKQYGVTAVELGAQSMSDEVLEANFRGHTAAEVYAASRLIQESGMELGLQMMTGLYGSSFEADFRTAQIFSEISPQTVRIYPTVILKGTALEKLYRSGSYVPVSFEDMAEFCAELLLFFQSKGIRVIRLGLHSSETLEEDIVGGYYHPAFCEICENMIFKRLLEQENLSAGSYRILVPKGAVSKAVGQRRCNAEYFKAKNIVLKFRESEKLSGYQILVTEEV